MNKDLYHYLSNYLNDKDILALSNVSSISRRYFDDKYWKRKLSRYPRVEHMNVFQDDWKYFYFYVSRCLQSKDHINIVKKLIDEDRYDILEMFYLFHSYPKSMTFYDWATFSRANLYPVLYAATKDSVNSFNFLKEDNCLISEIAIKHHSHKVLSHVITINPQHILQIIQTDCMECYKAVSDRILEDDIMQQLFFCKKTKQHIIETGSSVFSYIIRKVEDSKIQEWKNIALDGDNFDVIKCLFKYRSPFND